MAANVDKQSASQGPNKPTGDTPRVVYTPNSDSTPQGELAALASAYRFVIERAERRRSTGVEES